MSDLINRGLLLAEIENSYFGCEEYNAGKEVVIGYIENAPTIDAVEVKHGEWIVVSDDYDSWYECNLCGEYYYADEASNYCPNCGAKMDGAT